MWNKVPHNTYCLIVVLVAPTLVMVYTLTTISHITDDVISQQDQISLLINTLPARHWALEGVHKRLSSYKVFTQSHGMGTNRLTYYM